MNQNDIEAMIQRYMEAEMAVLDGKSVTFNGQQMTMENLSEIRQGRQEWERRLAALITRRRGHPGYPTASISDLLVVVMKKATAGISIS
ncbi:hypothetical protein ACGL21_004239 [Escherichia coli]